MVLHEAYAKSLAFPPNSPRRLSGGDALHIPVARVSGRPLVVVGLRAHLSYSNNPHSMGRMVGLRSEDVRVVIRSAAYPVRLPAGSENRLERTEILGKRWGGNFLAAIPEP